MKKFAQHCSQTLTELVSQPDIDSELPSLNIRPHAFFITTYKIQDSTLYNTCHSTPEHVSSEAWGHFMPKPTCMSMVSRI